MSVIIHGWILNSRLQLACSRKADDNLCIASQNLVRWYIRRTVLVDLGYLIAMQGFLITT